MRLWQEYRQVLQPKSIRRVAVRYSNQIELPLPLTVEDYFRTTPIIAAPLPQGVNRLFMSLGLPYGEYSAFITQAIAEVSEPAIDAAPNATFIFDIDASRSGNLAPDDEAIFPHLDRLRAIKNEIFFESLTPRALEHFL